MKNFILFFLVLFSFSISASAQKINVDDIEESQMEIQFLVSSKATKTQFKYFCDVDAEKYIIKKEKENGSTLYLYRIKPPQEKILQTLDYARKKFKDAYLVDMNGWRVDESKLKCSDEGLIIEY